MKILIADDSKVMRQIVTRTLRQAGFDGHDVVEAVDGADAFEKVKSESPDLVLSDWNMPNMTGIELLAQLRSTGSKVNFGFVTSETSQEMRDRAESSGALFLIAKPFTPEAFREALEPVIK
ncbi:two-component system chemotaxis response regulator CheY [Motilibacter rhizosphaerae]|uniref:Two-component system chemotaxis response regulator CheY n=1 Tax=Motilibacter rhizosphaerae TaxID=598652 RepID=A0A4Q7NYC1_9ACTN|nr:response regulator [Motilibacter rhizosphaerae]RZS91392.1 two-component system chemotaxis response regulator CheY [Motilibacter rhizosphaerae]